MDSAERQKQSGAYFTPTDAVRSLVSWVIRHPTDRMLDPSAGDGRFLALHRRSVGIEQDPQSAIEASKQAPWALVHEGDFFRWAASTKERFECAAGNPPFIRYQRFSGAIRDGALKLCSSLGASFSGLTSSWAPFLVATASLLKPGGRMAFVVPAEFGHAPYAQPLLEYLLSHFADIRILAVRSKIFSDLSENVWLLFADEFGQSTDHFLFSTTEEFKFSPSPPKYGRRVTVAEWRRWNCRLRPFLLPESIQALYQDAIAGPTTFRLGNIAQVGIGYVTGANNFFHLRPSEAARAGIPETFLHPTVRNGRFLVGNAITQSIVREWRSKDEPFLLLKISDVNSLPTSVRRYLTSSSAREAQSSYKCSNRDPWYIVPDVVVPDAFLSYMSGDGPTLVANRAKCSCTNSLHTVRLRKHIRISELQSTWSHPFTKLSCEIEGHPLGGGMLKIEPREAQQVALDTRKRWTKRNLFAIEEGIFELRRWRQGDGQKEAADLQAN